MPNFSSGMFSFSHIDLENSFAPLDNDRPEPNLDLPSSPLQNTSTPKKGSSKKRLKPNTNRGLKVINVNCRSICNKKAEFENMVDTVSPDIIVGTESWLSPDVADSEVFPVDLGYTVFRRDRFTTTRGGGVFILVRKQFTVSRVPELETDCELLWVKIELLGGKPLYVGAYYKPEESDEHSLSELNSSLSQFAHKGNPIWLLGDFNMPKYDWCTNSTDPCCRNLALYESFIDLIHDSNLQQMVDFPTRGENILDLYFTNRPTLVCKVAPLPGLSDHDVVYVESTLKPQVSKSKPRDINLYKKANWDNFRDFMGKYRDHVLSHTYTDVESLWTEFRDKISEGTSSFVPSKRIKGKNKLPWVNINIKRLIRKRDKLYHKQRKSNKQEDIQHYKNIKHLVQRKMRQAHNTYIDSILGIMESHIADNEVSPTQTYVPKKLFTLLKHAKRDSCGVSPLKEGGNLCSLPTEKANILNRQFHSVFSPKSPLSLQQLCQMKVSDIDSVEQDHPASKPAPPVSIMPELQVSTAGIDKLLKNLHTDKAAGPDQIPPIVLKELHEQVSPIIQVLFQISYETGTLPKEWCTANESPLFNQSTESTAGRAYMQIYNGW